MYFLEWIKNSLNTEKKGGNMDIQSTGTNHIQAFNLRAFATYGHKDHPLIFSLTSKTAFFGPFSFYYFSPFRLILKAIEDELCWSRPRPKLGKQFPFTKHITVLLLILWKLKEKNQHKKLLLSLDNQKICIINGIT